MMKYTACGFSFLEQNRPKYEPTELVVSAAVRRKLTSRLYHEWYKNTERPALPLKKAEGAIDQCYIFQPIINFNVRQYLKQYSSS